MQVYLDNAATSKCKPPQVLEAIIQFFNTVNCNPGRGGYDLSLEAGRNVLEVREKVADFFKIDHSNEVVFTSNITVALNMALKGLLKAGDHVLTSGIEHNAVLRPLRNLEKYRGIEISIIPTSKEGYLDPKDVEKNIKPNTKMIVTTHASNVAGTILPIAEIGEIALKYGLEYVIDTAQTAGAFEIDFQKTGATALCFTGHKHLLAPMGIGGLCLKRDTAEKMVTLYEGGTGSISDQEEQPAFLPDKFECGTLNTLGIVGLGAALDYLNKINLEEARQKEIALTQRLLEGIGEIPGSIIYGPQDARKQTGTVAFNFSDVDNAELCYVLDKEFGIMGRPGLHCSPLGHKTFGSFPEGAMRLSLGHFTTAEEIEYTLASLRKILL